jgi:tetratricopeptide (TPR) repeat protein
MTCAKLRRICVAAAALAISAALFRPQLSDALVSRGDDALYRGRMDRALAFYERALAVDPQSSTAADRSMFLLIQRRRRDALNEAVRIGRSIPPRARDVRIQADLGLCYLRLGSFAAAASAFAGAARIANDPAYFTFAGWSAYRAGRSAQARAMWTRALSLHPGFAPAVFAMRRSQ